MFDPVKITTNHAQIASSSGGPGSGASQSSSQRPSHANVAAIAGGVIGGVLGSLAILGLAIFWKRRNSRSIVEASTMDNTPNPYDHPPYTPYDDEPKELPSEELYAKEMKGSVLNHELEADVPEHHCMSPAELESPMACHEKDSTPRESTILPMAEFIFGTENGSTREGSLREVPLQPTENMSTAESTGINEEGLREMSVLVDAEDGGEELGLAKTDSRVVSMLVDDEVVEEISPIKTTGQ